MAIIPSIQNVNDGSGVYHWEQAFHPPSTVVNTFDESVDIAPTKTLTDVDVGDLVSQSVFRKQPQYQHKWGSVRKNHSIKMTDYVAIRHKSEKYVVHLPNLRAAWKFPSIDDTGQNFTITGDPVWMTTTWEENYTDDTLPGFIGQSYAPADLTEFQEQQAVQVEEVKAAVVADAYQTWDALTSRAELSQTLELITGLFKAARHPMQAYRNLVAKSNRDPKHISDLWLQYRYGIMPLIYDLLDYTKLLATVGFMFQTHRAQKFGALNIGPRITDEQMTFWEEDHSYRISATGKARYTSASMRALDQISFNPALTGW